MNFNNSEHNTEIQLLKGKTIRIKKLNISFNPWRGKLPKDTYGGKPIVCYARKPCFPELAILRIMCKEGWDGIWVDTYRKRYISANGKLTTLSVDKKKILEIIYQKAKNKYGAFDLFCWKGSDIKFIESKWKSKDKIRQTQIKWLSAAIECGFETNKFVIAEWQFNKTI